MESAVGVDDLAGAVVEFSLGDGGHRQGDVLRQSPTANGQQARGDLLVVFVLDAGRHVGGDDAGADFEHADAVFGQAVGEQRGHHAQARLADAIFSPRRRTGEGGNRADVDDAAAAVGVLGELADHPAGDLLRQKIGPLQVDSQHPFETLFRGIEQIDAIERRNAGVVDQQIAPPVALFHGFDRSPAVLRRADVGLNSQKAAPHASISSCTNGEGGSLPWNSAQVPR